MLIGILEAETLPEKVVAKFGSYGNMFEKLLKHIEPSFQFRYYAADQGQLPLDIDECDGYIITGSRFNAYDTDPWIENLKSLVREFDAAKKKCLGVCFGHQLIAEALGGKVERSDKGWGVGAAEFAIYYKPKFMTKMEKSFTILVSHQDQVIQLPSKAEHIAGNHFCPNAAFLIGDHIFSLQGHPEFSKQYLTVLISKRKTIIGAEKSDKALKSIEKMAQNFDFTTLVNSFFNKDPDSHPKTV